MNRRWVCLAVIFALVLGWFGAAPIFTRAESSLPYLELSHPERGRILSAAWSPNGHYVAVGTDKGLWLYTDTLGDVLHAPDRPVYAVAWSPDGETLAAGYFGQVASGSIDPSTGMPPREPPIEGGGLRLWSVTGEGQNLRLTPGAALFTDGSVYALQFSPDGSQLASLAQTRVMYYSDRIMALDVLRLHDMPSGALRLEATSDRTEVVQGETFATGANGLSWSSDGRYLATVRAFDEERLADSTDWPIYAAFSVWDTTRAQFVTKEYDFEKCDWPRDLAAVGWSALGNWLGRAGLPALWSDTWGGISLHPVDGSDLTGARRSCSPQPWPADSEQLLRIYALAWHPHRQIAAYTDLTGIVLWDSGEEKVIARLDAALDYITFLAWNPSGDKLLALGADDRLRIWTRFESYETPTPVPHRQIPLEYALNEFHASEIKLSPNGAWIAVPNMKTGRVEVINAVEGTLKRAFFVDAYRFIEDDIYWIIGNDITWSPDGTLLAIPYLPASLGYMGYGEGGCATPFWRDVQIYDVDSGLLLQTWPGIAGIFWWPDSQAAVVHLAEPNNAFEVRSVATRDVLQTLPVAEVWRTHHDEAASIAEWYYMLRPAASSPDGRFLAFSMDWTCGFHGSGQVILWDTVAQRIVGELDAWYTDWGRSKGGTVEVTWSPNGDYIAYSSYPMRYLYRLNWQGEEFAPELIWSRSNDSPLFNWYGTAVFSPDSRYFLYGSNIWESSTGRPVFRSRSGLHYHDYRWNEHSLIGYRWSSWDNQPAVIDWFRTNDFLPVGP